MVLLGNDHPIPDANDPLGLGCDVGIMGDEHQPALEAAPKTTRTAQGIPGDPLNVGLIATEEEVIKAMLSSGWDAADPITLRAGLGTLAVPGTLNVAANPLTLEGNEINLTGGANSILGNSSIALQPTSTGQAVSVTAKHIPYFKTGKQLRERLNTDA